MIIIITCWEVEVVLWGIVLGKGPRTTSISCSIVKFYIYIFLHAKICHFHDVFLNPMEMYVFIEFFSNFSIFFFF